MYWPDLGKVQEIGDMNIVSQMCAIAVMFVIMYFYISQKKIILHTSKAFVEVWIAGLLSLFFDIFALVAIEKEADILILLPILSANYISGRSHGLPWWPFGIYAWIFSGKKSLSASGESGCGYLES